MFKSLVKFVLGITVAATLIQVFYRDEFERSAPQPIPEPKVEMEQVFVAPSDDSCAEWWDRFLERPLLSVAYTTSALSGERFHEMSRNDLIREAMVLRAKIVRQQVELAAVGVGTEPYVRWFQEAQKRELFVEYEDLRMLAALMARVPVDYTYEEGVELLERLRDGDWSSWGHHDILPAMVLHLNPGRVQEELDSFSFRNLENALDGAIVF